ncbi:conjugal transfer transcriptional regulator TraJ [Janthinobacterium sp. PSPC3-1]|uniref:conjugal transfer transcriptional regulator TraJ n=1 Tax=Janthinobacterium sp. PSPC3-1 TaxID=2804653 RepID=UPI003CF5C190
MEKPAPAATRKARHLRVPVLPAEEAQIKRLAAAAGLPVAAYLRKVGLGYRLPGILDHRRVEELARINGDLGRLGGLLKLWLTNDERTAAFGEATIRAVLAKIADTQDEMHAVMRAVVLPHGGAQFSC